MTTVNLQHQYIGSTTSSASAHSGNLFDKDNPEYGLFSSVNGNLSAANIATDLTKDNVVVSEYMFVDRYAWQDNVVVYDDTLGGRDTDEELRSIAVGLSFYLPCRVEQLRIDYNFFLTAARPAKLTRTTSSATSFTQVSVLAAFIQPTFDGTAIAGSKIPLAKSLLGSEAFSLASGTFGSANHLTSLEHLTANNISGSYVRGSTGAGRHVLEFKVYLENASGGMDLDFGETLGRVSKEHAISARMHQRLTLGTGCVTVRALGLT